VHQKTCHIIFDNDLNTSCPFTIYLIHWLLRLGVLLKRHHNNCKRLAWQGNLNIWTANHECSLKLLFS